MAGPVEAVETQIRTWRESPEEACGRLETCARAFSQRALIVEETLSGLAPQRRQPPEPETERQWRWKRKGYALFWAITAALSLLALAAGYFAAFDG